MDLKLLSRSFLLFILGAFVINISAATDDASKYKVGTWGNFAQGAISHTFDDYPNQTANQVGSGQDAFNAKGFHMTLFVQVGSVSNWGPLKTAFAKGHEIASHNMSHDVSTGTFKTAQDNVRKYVPGEMCATLAYPNCTCNEDAATLKVYIAARNCSGAQNPKTPGKWAQINSQLAGNRPKDNYPNSASEFNAIADNAAKANGWAVLGHHGVGNDGHGWANTDLNALKQHLDYLDKNRNKIWIETFGNVARYIQERDKAKITAKTSTGNSYTITVATTGLDTSIFNYPLCLRRELPSGWTTAKVTQNGNPVYDTIVTDSSKKYIQFDAVPNGTDVVISNDGTSIMPNSFAFKSPHSVLYQKSSLIIDAVQFGSAGLDVTLYNLQGKALAHYTFGLHESTITFPVNKFNYSPFIVKVVGGGKTYVGTFMPQL